MALQWTTKSFTGAFRTTRWRLSGFHSYQAAACSTKPIDVPQPVAIDVTIGGGKLILGRKAIEVAGKEFSIVSPLDVDAVMDWYIERDMQDRDPYWAVLWASTIAMAELITREPELVRGKRVAEIGCGLGVAGIAAALAGAAEVVLMDRELCSLQCALLTATASGIGTADSAAGFASSKQEASSIRAFEERCRNQHITPVTCPVRAAPFDWNLPVERSDFDVVIACDVLYEPFSVSPLSRVIPSLLGSGSWGQRVLLTDPPHRAPENRRRFMEKLAEVDPEMRAQKSYAVTARVDGQDTDILVVVLRRRLDGETVALPLTSVL